MERRVSLDSTYEGLKRLHARVHARENLGLDSTYEGLKRRTWIRQ